jgi:hypothetical protein
MGKLELSYYQIENSTNSSRTVAKRAREYAAQLSRGINDKISSLTNGGTSNTNSASWFVQAKINSLGTKADRFDNYANKLESFSQKVRETDKNLASSFEKLSTDFRKSHGMKVSPIRDWITKMSVGFMNSTSFGRWVKDKYNSVKSFITDKWTAIKHWYKCEGGKFLMDIVVSVASIALCVVIILAGPELFAFIIAVGAAISAINEINNIVTSAKAYSEARSGDPAMAERYGKMDRLSDSIRSYVGNNATVDKVLYNFAGLWDTADTFCTIVTTVVPAGKFISKRSFAFKNLFGNRKSGLGLRFLSNRVFLNKNIIDWNSFRNGMRALITDDSFRERLGKKFVIDLKYDIKCIPDTFRYSLKSLEQYRYLMKRVISTDITDRKRALSIIKKTFIDEKIPILKGVSEKIRVKGRANVVKEITDNIKKSKDNLSDLGIFVYNSDKFMDGDIVGGLPEKYNKLLKGDYSVMIPKDLKKFGDALKSITKIKFFGDNLGIKHVDLTGIHLNLDTYKIDLGNSRNN